MKDIASHIEDLDSKIQTLQQRKKTADEASADVFQEAIEELQVARDALEEQTRSGREPAESFWAQHQKQIDESWHKTIQNVVGDLGDQGVNTSENR